MLDCDLRLIAGIRDARHHFLFHDLVLIHHKGSGQRTAVLFIKAGEHLHAHALFHRKFHAASL